MHREDSTAEEWRPIAGHEGRYEVSSAGRVRSLDRTITCSNGRTQRRPGKLLSPVKQNTGYLSVRLASSNPIGVHRLVAVAFLGPSGLPLVRHINGDPTDNALSNLAWGTYPDNEADKRRHGRALIGERHHQALLTGKDVRDIRAVWTGAYGQATRLGRKYGVSRTTISRAATGRTWSHL
jgi:hypothetical protein